MQLASYNVEDLFCRARALSLATWAHEAIDMFPARCDDYHEALPKTPERACRADADTPWARFLG